MGLADISGLISGITAAAVSIGDDWWTWFSQAFWPEVWQETKTLLSAPADNPEILWVAIPLFVTLLMMTFYFGMYRKEKMSWDSAVGNSIVLLFVTIDLLRFIYNYTDPASALNYVAHIWKTGIVILVMVEAFIMIFFNFFHILPPRLAYFIAAPLPVNLQAYVIAAVVYTRRDPTMATLWAALLLFVVLLIVLRLLQWGEGKMLEHMHESEVDEAQRLRDEAEHLKHEAETAGEERQAKDFLEAAKQKDVEADKLLAEAMTAEQVEFGQVRERIKERARKLLRKKAVKQPQESSSRPAKKPRKR